MYVRAKLCSGAEPKLQIPNATATWGQDQPFAKAYPNHQAPASWNGMKGRKT